MTETNWIGTAQELIENENLKQRFRAQHEDASDECVEQAKQANASESPLIRSLSGLQPRAIKYLNFIEAAKVLKEEPGLRDKYLEDFLDKVDGKFKNSKEISIEMLMDEISFHYTTMLDETDALKNFNFED